MADRKAALDQLRETDMAIKAMRTARMEETANKFANVSVSPLNERSEFDESSQNFEGFHVDPSLPTLERNILPGLEDMDNPKYNRARSVLIEALDDEPSRFDDKTHTERKQDLPPLKLKNRSRASSIAKSQLRITTAMVENDSSIKTSNNMFTKNRSKRNSVHHVTTSKTVRKDSRNDVS